MLSRVLGLLLFRYAPYISGALSNLIFTQEDPFKLVILAKDIRRIGVATADFFFSEGDMSIVTSDDDGILRVYQYDPSGKTSRVSLFNACLTSTADPESKNGQHLLCRTEFHGQAESQTSVIIARRPQEDHVLPQAKLISGMLSRSHGLLYSKDVVLGSTDGSISSLTSIDESVFKRLQLLQGQLTRNIQHFAGLNPKAFRLVPWVSFSALADHLK